MPYFNPFREDRRRRMRELIDVIARQGEMDVDYVLGWGGLKWGSTESSIMAMLTQLEKARLLEIDNEQHKVRYVGERTEEEKEKDKEREKAVKRKALTRIVRAEK